MRMISILTVAVLIYACLGVQAQDPVAGGGGGATSPGYGIPPGTVPTSDSTTTDRKAVTKLAEEMKALLERLMAARIASLEADWARQEAELANAPKHVREAAKRFIRLMLEGTKIGTKVLLEFVKSGIGPRTGFVASQQIYTLPSGGTVTIMTLINSITGQKLVVVRIVEGGTERLVVDASGLAR